MNNNIDINAVITVAQQAGDAIMEIYRKDFAIYEKSDESPLTEADLASHRIIVESLKEMTP
jgi:3'(2'), 5'-bisphosphate nucleotidase